LCHHNAREETTVAFRFEGTVTWQRFKATAGFQAFKAILDWEDADWHDTIDLNPTGTCNATRTVTPHLLKDGGGRIIVTSSTPGRHGTKYGAAYSAAEWGMTGLMKSAALEFGQYGITVNLHSRPHRHALYPATHPLCPGCRRFWIKTIDCRR
jgi:NADP-dependent 3-hydroxy acid dehydrogenase YdfG